MNPLCGNFVHPGLGPHTSLDLNDDVSAASFELMDKCSIGDKQYQDQFLPYLHDFRQRRQSSAVRTLLSVPGLVVVADLPP